MSKFVVYTDKEKRVFVMTQKNEEDFIASIRKDAGLSDPDEMNRDEIEDGYLLIDPELNMHVS